MQHPQQTGLVVFRSRQQVQRFENMLKESGIRARIINTPYEIAIGCGLSIAFEREDYAKVQKCLQESRGLTSFVGCYACRAEGTRMRCTAWKGEESPLF